MSVFLFSLVQYTLLKDTLDRVSVRNYWNGGQTVSFYWNGLNVLSCSIHITKGQVSVRNYWNGGCLSSCSLLFNTHY